jgi:hypothetical protein
MDKTKSTKGQTTLNIIVSLLVTLASVAKKKPESVSSE